MNPSSQEILGKPEAWTMKDKHAQMRRLLPLSAKIRVLDSTGKLERTIAFSETGRKL